MSRPVHPIERESYRILRALLPLHGWPPLARAVCERIVHATADVGWADELVWDETALATGTNALREGAPLVADVRMTGAGITSRETVCAIDLAGEDTHPTRTAAGIRQAAARVGTGAVWVVGCAPTALDAVLEHAREPALVIGLPVGFVGAVEAKRALAESSLPAVTNRTARGGAAVAAAACNGLLYAEGGS